MKKILERLAEFIVPLGAPGLFLVALMDSGLIPLPVGVDALLTLLVAAKPGNWMLYAALATAGSILGCIFLYYISQKAGEAALARHTSVERIATLRVQFEKYEALTLVIPAMVPLPLPMKLFVIAAGVFRVRLRSFVLAILLGRVVRYFGIALLVSLYGAVVGAYIQQNKLWIAVGTILLMGSVYWWSRRFR